MRLGLVGFGRTGRTVAGVLLRRPDTELAWVVRREQPSGCRHASTILGIESSDPGLLLGAGDVTAADLLAERPVDAVIDFSSQDGIDYYADAAAELGVPIVCAVSAFDEDVTARFAAWGRTTPALWSPNITLGINVLLIAARALRSIAPDADVQIVEEHFQGKREISGTALRVASALGVPRSEVHSLRAGGIVGNHEVLFGFDDQTLRIRHESLSREAFGNGAVFAAQQLAGRRDGFYRMEDLLAPFLNSPSAN